MSYTYEIATITTGYSCTQINEYGHKYYIGDATTYEQAVRICSSHNYDPVISIITTTTAINEQLQHMNSLATQLQRLEYEVYKYQQNICDKLSRLEHIEKAMLLTDIAFTK